MLSCRGGAGIECKCSRATGVTTRRERRRLVTAGYSMPPGWMRTIRSCPSRGWNLCCLWRANISRDKHSPRSLPVKTLPSDEVKPQSIASDTEVLKLKAACRVLRSQFNGEVRTSSYPTSYRRETFTSIFPLPLCLRWHYHVMARPKPKA